MEKKYSNYSSIFFIFFIFFNIQFSLVEPDRFLMNVTRIAKKYRKYWNAMKKKVIKRKNTSCLLWFQERYEENITEGWIEKIKTEKSYQYRTEDVARIARNISVELTKTFLFWSLWSHMMRDGYTFEKIVLTNFTLWPRLVELIW